MFLQLKRGMPYVPLSMHHVERKREDEISRVRTQLNTANILATTFSYHDVAFILHLLKTHKPDTQN